MDVRLLDSAVDDLRRGWLFYERQCQGLGDDFLDAIDADVRALPSLAGIHFKVNGFYRMLIPRVFICSL